LICCHGFGHLNKRIVSFITALTNFSLPDEDSNEEFDKDFPTLLVFLRASSPYRQEGQEGNWVRVDCRERDLLYCRGKKVLPSSQLTPCMKGSKADLTRCFDDEQQAS